MLLELKISSFDLSASVETHKTSVKVETADWSSVHYVILPTSFHFSVSSSGIGKGRNLPEPAHELFSHLSIITAIPCKESQSRKAFFEASASTQTFLSKVEVPLVCLRRQERKNKTSWFPSVFCLAASNPSLGRTHKGSRS